MSSPTPESDPHTPGRPATRREEQRRQTRERVFAAALDEFRRVGVASAQIERIAEAAGVVRGTFYFHFPSKDHALLELLLRVEGEVASRLLADTRAASLRGVLECAVDAVLGEIRALSDARLVRDLVAIYARTPGDPALASQPHPFVVALTRRIAQAAEREPLRGALDADRLAVIFLTSVFGFLIVAGDAPWEQREAFDALIDVFLDGVGS